MDKKPPLLFPPDPPQKPPPPPPPPPPDEKPHVVLAPKRRHNWITNRDRLKLIKRIAQNDESVAEISFDTGISVSNIYRYRRNQKHWLEDRRLDQKMQKRNAPSSTDPHRKFLLDLMNSHNEHGIVLSRREIVDRYAEEIGETLPLLPKRFEALRQRINRFIRGILPPRNYTPEPKPKERHGHDQRLR